MITTSLDQKDPKESLRTAVREILATKKIEGAEMLQTSFQRKQAITTLQALENRIKRLQYEDNRLEKQTKEAQQKKSQFDEIQRKQNAHRKTVEDWKLRESLKQEQRRNLFRQRRERTETMLRSSREALHSKHRAISQDIKNTTKINECAVEAYLAVDQQRKFERKTNRSMVSTTRRNSISRAMSTVARRTFENYANRKADNKKVEEEAAQKARELAKLEADIKEKLEQRRREKEAYFESHGIFGRYSGSRMYRMPSYSSTSAKTTPGKQIILSVTNQSSTSINEDS